ncbi:MAG: hypothetical protein NWF14_08735 [Candidatus Bathyarchaeota archaeon]|nr:hypothetical protein [Candidatus Bathyarchaeota archaeon]
MSLIVRPVVEVCQEAECHNIWRLSDKLSLVGIREPPVGRG